MIKFLICLFGVHHWKLIDRTSYPPSAKVRKIDGELTFAAECVVLGYSKSVSLCEYCRKTEERIDLGP
jgi:hypothetical protein